MSDDKNKRDDRQDDHELTFESGYGAQDKVLQEDETLEDVAGVSEEDIRKDVRETQEESEADSDKEQKDEGQGLS